MSEPKQKTADCTNQYERTCRARFDNLDTSNKEILDLLRGRGQNPGLIGDVHSHSEFIADLRNILYGEKPGEGMAYTVSQLTSNSQSRRTTEQQNKAFVRGIIAKLITAVLIALAALLLSLYRSRPPAGQAAKTTQNPESSEP